MASINMTSILSKAGGYMNSTKGKNKTDTIISKAMLGSVKLTSSGSVHTPEEAASKFIEVLRRTIESCGLSANAIEAISQIEATAPTQIGDTNTFLIRVYFAGDLSRPSLDEATYGGISDIVALFNNGIDHTMRPVHGVWHGQDYWSRTTIPGTHFIEQAISDFQGNYAHEYNVIDISTEGL